MPCLTYFLIFYSLPIEYGASIFGGIQNSTGQCSEQLAVGGLLEVALGDLQRSLPVSTILQFCYPAAYTYIRVYMYVLYVPCFIICLIVCDKVLKFELIFMIPAPPAIFRQ